MKSQPRNVISDLIIEDILKRLPIKSLMRLKCVSHSFHALIKNPRFGLKQLSHFKQTNNNPINILFKFNHVESSQTRMVQLSGGGGDRLSVTEVDLPKKACSSLYPHEFSLVGHCNGVLCLCCPSNRCLCGSVILYNPTIGESKVVPQPSSSNYDESQYSRRVKFGFGCTPNTNDLVVIMITVFLHYRSVKANDFPWKIKNYTLVEEYSLRTNSWREVKEFPELFFIKSFWFFHKGVYYWTSEFIFLSGREIILRFDSSGESLRLMPMPSDEEINSDTQTCLGVVQDSLVLVCWNNAKSYLSIWMTKLSAGDCMKGSWTMITSINYSIPYDLWPFLVPLKGEIFVGVTTDHFIVFDISTKQIKKLAPDSGFELGRDGPFDGLHAVNYVQSIISLNCNLYGFQKDIIIVDDE